MSPPLFSVVTVVRDDRAGLARTRASLAAQRFAAFEWVVVDGASSDGTVDDLRRDGDPRLRWSSEPDAGIYDAMNKGTRRADGRFVQYLNAGDELASPDALARVAAAIEASADEPDVVFAGARFLLANGAAIAWHPLPLAYVRHGLPANHQATFYRRAAIPPAPYDPSYRVCGDYEIVARLSLRSPRVASLDEAVVLFHDGGLSSRRPVALLRECLRVQREVLELPAGERARSAARRAVNMAAVRALSRPAMAPVARAVLACREALRRR